MCMDIGINTTEKLKISHYNFRQKAKRKKLLYEKRNVHKSLIDCVYE